MNVLVAPAASDIYKENVPANAPLLDEDGYLDQLSAAVQAAGGSFVDVRPTLTAHKSEYIITAPTTTGQALAPTTLTASCARPLALPPLIPPPTLR